MNIKGKVVTLRAMTRSDMQMICDMFNDPFLEDVVVGWSFPLSIEQQNAWFDRNINSDGKNFRFVIETPEDGAVGIATRTNIDWKNGTATHGIKLANKEKRTKGIGTDTVMAIMRYAFDELGMVAVNADTVVKNTRSQHILEKIGFQFLKEEGYFRYYRLEKS